MPRLKTFVKWSGNKSRSLKHILPKIPEFETYYEPFLGSGAVFLSLAPQKWVVNDVNPDLYALWQTLASGPEARRFMKCFNDFACVLAGMHKTELLETCKELTQTLNTSRASLKRSVLYLIMKSLVYNGHLYFKDKFKFYTFDLNIHTYADIYLFSQKYADNLRAVCAFLQNSSSSSVHNKDYTDVLKSCKKGDFVFLDPPYVEDHDYQFVYNKEEKLDDRFLLDLRKQVEKLDKKKVKWLMTQADTPRIRHLFGNYFITEFPVYRMPKKKFVKELFVSNYDTR